MDDEESKGAFKVKGMGKKKKTRMKKGKKVALEDEPPVKLGWKTRLMKSMFGSIKKQVTKRMAEREVARKIEEDEAVRLIKRRIEDIDLKQFWLNVRVEELYTWSLIELRTACAQRGLPQDGIKTSLVDRLIREAWKDRKRLQRQKIMATLQDQREGEAAGSVYCFGMGYGEDYQSHDRPFIRENLTIMTKLSGMGVHQVEAGFDSTLCYAVCENGDVWTWGEVRPDEAAPVGFKRPLVYDANIKERATLFRTDYRFRKPRLAGNDMIGTTPKGLKPHHNKARKPPKPVIGAAKFVEEDDEDSDDSAAEDRKRREILEEVLAEMHDPYFISPVIIPKLRGEGVINVTAARTHAMALTDGGDLFVWGAAEGGMLGIGAVKDYVEVPVELKTIDSSNVVRQAVAGTSHSAAVTTNGKLFTWGYSGSGRLGLGEHVRQRGAIARRAAKRIGKNAAYRMEYVTEPVPLKRLFKDRVSVRQIAAGSQHCVALTTLGVMTWGVGDGGRLGHGDTEHRWTPALVETLNNMIVIQVAAGSWHSACIVQIPPHSTGGYVYTWGAGYNGQLGLRGRSTCPYPKIVPGFVERNTTVTYISCGAYHNAVLTSDGDCMTWGSNAGNCLGRPAQMALKEQSEYDIEPGRVEGLREYGIGEICSVTCGNRMTALATLPYAQLPRHRVREMARLDLAREQASKRLVQEADSKHQAAMGHVANQELRKNIEALNAARPLCSACTECDGFVPSLFKPMQCDVCGHDRKQHDRKRVAGNVKYAAEAAATIAKLEAAPDVPS